MRIILILLVAWQVLLAQGEIVQIGAQYDPGTRIYFPSHGISFVVPREWKGGLSIATDAFVMTSETKAGLGLALLKSDYHQASLEKYLHSVQNLGDNIVLQPVGPVEHKESGMFQHYSSSLYRGQATAKIGPHNQSIVFLFTGPVAQEKYYQSIVEKIVRTVTFHKPDLSLLIKDWQKKLSGMRLDKMVSPSDSSLDTHSTKTHFTQIHLCSDGSYRSSAKTQGKWKIEINELKPQLLLQNTHHETLVYTLGIAKDKFLLNGVYYTIQKSQECK